MPVNILYCEGGAKSPDIRLLSHLLKGVAFVRADDTKYGLASRVLARRGVLRESQIVAAIRDRDFDRDPDPGNTQPFRWNVNDNGKDTWVGWYWRRTELENYLIDPIVVHRAAPGLMSEAGYASVLNSAMETLWAYTAARAALSRSRSRFNPLPNKWGTACSLDDHRVPDLLTEDDCRQGLSSVVAAHSQQQTVSAAAILGRFDELLPLCAPGCKWASDPLASFSGKDILCRMRAGLASHGVASIETFRERILKGIDASTENVWTWLPEWTALRSEVAAA